MQERITYLDNAATTSMPEEVIHSVMYCMGYYLGNPSSVHGVGRRARVFLEASRRKVASLLHAMPSQIFFTSGGTEANNAILWSCYFDLGRDTFITSRIEHPAVINTLETMARHVKVKLLYVNTLADGHIDLNHLGEILKETPHAVVSLMHANNEIGNLLPVKQVSEMCKQHSALFHSDTVQTIGKYRLDCSHDHFDFAVASAHKFHGPKGVGFMYIREGQGMHSFLSGGNQERGMRAGTENLCGIAGLTTALEWSLSSLEGSQTHIRALKNMLLSRLQENIPGIAFNGDAFGSSAYSIVNFVFPVKIDAAILLSRLDMAGICISTGSACSSGSTIRSHVLSSLGVKDSFPSLRVSMSRFNTTDDVNHLVNELVAIRRSVG